MKIFSYYFLTDSVKKIIDDVVKLGIKQNGYILDTQFQNIICLNNLNNYELKALRDALDSNNIVITNKTLSMLEYEKTMAHDFLPVNEINVEGVEQIDECLTPNEIKEVSFAKYDVDLSKDERVKIYNKYANRIKHVENCDRCLVIFKRISDEYRYLYDNFIENPNEIFKEWLIKYCQDLLDYKEATNPICEKEGHDFSDWSYRKWKVNDKNYRMDKNGTIVYEEWSRKCKRCQKEEKTRIMPEELKERNKVKRKAL